MQVWLVRFGAVAMVAAVVCSGCGPRPAPSIGRTADAFEAWGADVCASLPEFSEEALLQSGEGLTSRQAIADTVRARRPEVQACYESSLGFYPEAEGDVVIRWVVGPEGRVLALDVERNTHGSNALGCCIAKVVYETEFPRPEGGHVSVRYPFRLQLR